MSYATFKSGVLGRVIGDGQCVSLVVNNAQAYVEAIWPGVSWPTIIGPVVGAKDMFATASPAYFDKISNDVNNASQVPVQGDIMIFSQTPYAGYTNTYNNPYGHTGICESADSSGYSLLQQNSPYAGAPAQVNRYAWKFRHCVGWLRPKGQVVSNPPAPHLSLQINPGNWAVYTGDGKASPRLPGSVQGGQKYGPVSIASNGWGIITFTGKTGHIEPASFHLI
jgi:hypothetical protein